MRLSTGIGELDRVLGGGLVAGSLVLLGGSPGIGKSTLTNMALGNLSDAGKKALYVSGEESAEQVRLRAERLAPGALEVPVLAETDLERILDVLASERPDACVIDSVQTMQAGELSGSPGSVGQVREVAARLMGFAKQSGSAIILVGHVTKDGALAGPRVLEHLVDCVLQFEGERERPYRELRALKNRFGSTSEAGLFEMRQGGWWRCCDASARFVAAATRAPGSVVFAAMEGSATPARRGPGAGRALRAGAASPGRFGPGSQQARARARDPRPPRGDRYRRRRRLRQRRGRRAHRRARRGSPARARPRVGREGKVAAGRPSRLLRRAGPDGELRWVGHPERRMSEAAKHGLGSVLAPAGSGEGLCEVGTLRGGARARATRRLGPRALPRREGRSAGGLAEPKMP